MNNYKLLCEKNNLNYKNIVKASQAHTDNILNINETNLRKTIDTNIKVDGLITDKKEIVLATTNADCILLLMFDPIKKVIANVHSGWRGTLQEISVKTVVLNPSGMKTVELIEITAEPIKPTTAGFNPDIHPFMTILF